jgi:hypothetical protein
MKTNTKIREAEIREVQSRLLSAEAKLLNAQENVDKLTACLSKLENELNPNLLLKRKSCNSLL